MGALMALKYNPNQRKKLPRNTDFFFGGGVVKAVPAAWNAMTLRNLHDTEN